MTPEGRVKSRVKALLKKYNVYYFMPVQTGMGSRTLDFLCCVGGNFFAIETKKEGADLTPVQKVIKREIEDTGGDVFVIAGVDSETFFTLEVYLRAHETERPTRTIG